MKDSILKRARDGAAILISSHLLHLLEEICSHVLILKNGRQGHRRHAGRGAPALFRALRRFATLRTCFSAPPAKPRKRHDRRRAVLLPISHSSRTGCRRASNACASPNISSARLSAGCIFISTCSRAFLRGTRQPRCRPPTTNCSSPSARCCSMVAVLLAWIVPHSRSALAFSEAEAAFLFPAPITRRTLINFKLLKSQFAILFSAVADDDYRARIGRRQFHHPRRGMVGAAFDVQPASARQFVWRDDADGPRDFHLASARPLSRRGGGRRGRRLSLGARDLAGALPADWERRIFRASRITRASSSRRGRFRGCCFHFA